MQQTGQGLSLGRSQWAMGCRVHEGNSAQYDPKKGKHMSGRFIMIHLVRTFLYV